MWQSCGKRQRLCFSEIEKSSQQDTVSSFIILYSFYTPGAAPVVACAAGPEEFPEEIVTSAGEDGAGDAGLLEVLLGADDLLVEVVEGEVDGGLGGGNGGRSSVSHSNFPFWLSGL